MPLQRVLLYPEAVYIYIDRYIQYIVNAVSFSRRIYQLAAIETISLQSVLHKIL